ncbi:MAG: hypothetical protein RIN56_16990 [Sporomusaceae bacterium]|nr:hypothetical protein [Sporomusaceae bacterium]
MPIAKRYNEKKALRKRALVLGGEDTALRVVLKLAELGHPVTFLPYSQALPGKLALQISRYPDVCMYEQAQLVSFEGKVGDFVACIRAVSSGQSLIRIRAGAIVLISKNDAADVLSGIAGQLGIALNDYGSVATNQFCPVLTNKSGIFVVGESGRPEDPAKILSLADKAAMMAAYILEPT